MVIGPSQLRPTSLITPWRKLRTLQAYRSGFRDVTPDAARALAAYLRKRARLLQRAADSLEAAAERAIRKEEDDATP